PLISVKEMDEPTTFGRKRSSPKQNEDDKKKDKAKIDVGGEAKSNHDIHIQIEIERRKKMGEILSELHGFLPQPSPKADKSTILDEAVSYIKTLQNTLQKLEEQKQERLQAGMKLPSVGR
ncbi:hypothetical protein HAX54_031269, partial [Datura stramonium]|nr:hypothetical protein [Datura stramonium]